MARESMYGGLDSGGAHGMTAGREAVSSSNACAEDAHAACYGPMTKPMDMAVRQCTHGYFATECRCYSRGAMILSEMLVGPRCYCKLAAVDPMTASWAMVLSCEKAENVDSDAGSEADAESGSKNESSRMVYAPYGAY